MLKRKPRCARPRLQTGQAAAATAASAVVCTQANEASAPWPEIPAAVASHKEPVWLCIALPALALEALPAGSAALATVVVAEREHRQVVRACNPAAAARGVQTGMALTAAHALCPALQVLVQDVAAERAYLHELADAALTLSSMVHVADEGAVLLEVGGSLRLFGGLERLRQRLLAELTARGCGSVLACAPTARAALWLARAGYAECCVDRRALPGLLGRLHLTELGWPAATVLKLRQMGVVTLADCMRLPRAGFVRRLGRTCLLELDQALGAEPQLLTRHREPEWFKAQESLLTETVDTALIEQLCERLLQRLGEFLRRRQAAVHQVLVNLQHTSGSATCVQVELREPAAQPAYLQELLHLQLERLVLQAPVQGLTLTAEALCVTDAEPRFATRTLPGMAEHDPAEQAARVCQLTERLRARLGKTRVHGLELVPEHRPERAWRSADPQLHTAAERQAAKPEPEQPRPLWLLTEPRPVRVSAVPHRRVLERIETGWWDGGDVRRDYATVCAADGSRWWVYRDRSTARWYLHGLFG